MRTQQSSVNNAHGAGIVGEESFQRLRSYSLELTVTIDLLIILVSQHFSAYVNKANSFALLQ